MGSKKHGWLLVFAATLVVALLGSRPARAESASRQVAAEVNGNDKLVVVYVGTDGTLWSQRQSTVTTLNGATRNLQYAGYVTSDSPLNADWTGTTWGPPVQIFGGQVQTVTLAKNADGRLETFFISGGLMYHAYQQSSGDAPFYPAVTQPTSAFQFFGGWSASNLVVGTNAGGTLEVFWISAPAGSGGYVNHVWQTAPSSGWSAVNELTYAGETGPSGPVPAVGTSLEIAVKRQGSQSCEPTPCGALNFFFLASGVVWEIVQNTQAPGGWQAPTTLAGVKPGALTASHIAVQANLDGHLSLLYADATNSGKLCEAYQSAPLTDAWVLSASNPIGPPATFIATAVNSPSLMPGNTDVTSSKLYGQGGTLDGTKLTMSVDGAAPQTLLFQGSVNASSTQEMLSAIQSTWPAVNADTGGSMGNALVLTTATGGSIVIDESSTALAPLGLATPGRIEVMFVGSDGNLHHLAQSESNGPAWSVSRPFGWGAASVYGHVDQAGCLQVFYLRPNTKVLTTPPGEVYGGGLFRQYQLSPGHWWSGEYPLENAPPPAFLPVATSSFQSILLPYSGGDNNDHTIVSVPSATNEKFGAGYYLFGITTAPGHSLNASGAAYSAGPLLASSPSFSYADYLPSSSGGLPTDLRYTCNSTCGAMDLWCTPGSCNYPAAFCTSPCNGEVRWAPHVTTVGAGSSTKYYMVYAEGGPSLSQWVIGLRTSTDLVTWTGGVTPACSELGAPGCALRSDCTWASSTCSLKSGATPLVCSILHESDCNAAAGCVWLSQGVGSCTGVDTAPLFTDGLQARDPMILGGETLGEACSSTTCTSGVCSNGVCEAFLYYDATSSSGPGVTDDPAGGNHVVAFRTSTDSSFLTWSTTPTIAYYDFHTGGDYGPTESPFVVQHGPYYYLFIGPRPYDDPMVTNGDTYFPTNQPDDPRVTNVQSPGYVGTDVFKSPSPTGPWTNLNYVGSIPAHALEVVHDPNTQLWYVTSAGTNQGGIYAAPLTWTCATAADCDTNETCTAGTCRPSAR